MPDYSDYSDIVNSATIGDFGSTVTFTIADDKADLDDDSGDITYYGTGSDEYDYFEGSFSNESAIYSAILDIIAGSPSNSYSVLFTDVTNITLTNADSAGNDDTYFDQNEAIGEVVIGTVTKDHVAFDGNEDATAFTYLDSAGASKQGDIWINTDHESATFGSSVNIWDDGSIVTGTYAWQTLVHEVGHSLGLKHSDGSNIDNQKYTTMSYVKIPGMEDSSSLSNSVAPAGLQLFDIAALQEEYGRNFDTRDSATTYKQGQGFGATINDGFIYTIWDGGGTDEIDASGYADGVTIDLRQGGFSSIGKAGNSSYDAGRGAGLAVDNVAIAFHSIIENATGTADDDTIIGNAWDNDIDGGAGDDILYGDGVVSPDGDNGYGADSGEYDSNNNDPDAATDDSGDDTINGGAGDDTLFGGAGDDTLDGGADTDTVDYSKDSAGVTVNLSTGTATDGNGDTDTLSNIENVTGSAYDDTLTGNNADNIFYERGNDGQDDYDGGTGTDTIDYSGWNTGVALHMNSDALGSQVDSTDGTFTTPIVYELDGDDERSIDISELQYTLNHTTENDFENVENIVGTDYNDLFIDDATTANDYDGGDGIDVLDVFMNAFNAVVDLSAGTITNTSNVEDSFENIEGFVHGWRMDWYINNVELATVDEVNNGFFSGGFLYKKTTAEWAEVVFHDPNTGNYEVLGNGWGVFEEGENPGEYDQGVDVATVLTVFDSSGDVVRQEIIDDLAYTGNLTFWGVGTNGDDNIIGDHNGSRDKNDRIKPGAGDDDVDAGGGNDIIEDGSGAGNDDYDGGTGIDILAYSRTSAGITVDLSAASNHATGTEIGTDQISNIEFLIAGSGNDSLTGDANANRFTGMAGDDTLKAGAGNDGYVFAIGDGSDSIEDTSGSSDYIFFEAGINPDDLAFTVNSNDLNIDYGSDDIDIIGQLDSGGTKQIERIRFDDGTDLSLKDYASWSLGTTGADNPTLTASADYYWGDEGDDTLDGGDGDDELAGGDGDDTIGGDGGADVLSGGGGDDEIDGDAGADIIYGGDGADDIDGGNQNDIIIAGLGDDDYVYGGNGNDTIYDVTDDLSAALDYTMESGTWAAGTYDDLRGGSGNDHIYQQVGDAYLLGDSGSDTYHLFFHADGTPGYKVSINDNGNQSGDKVIFETLNFDDLNYYWTFGETSSFLSGNGDKLNDLVLHYTGTKTETEIVIRNEYNSSTPRYSIDYFEFADGTTKHITDMPFFIEGTQSADTLNGTDNADYIVSLNGGDTITAGDGDDFIGTGNGDDTIYAGDGNDSVMAFSGTDTIYGGAGNDTIDLWGGGTVYGDDGDDFIKGSTLGNSYVIYGGNGDDDIDTGNDDDLLVGGSGNDILNARNGDDTLDGGSGDDDLNGGSGNDLFIYSEGLDEFIDGGGTDVINITGGTTLNDISVANYGTNEAKITITASVDEIVVENLRSTNSNQHIESLAFDDGFVTDQLPDYNSWIKGTSGNDTVAGNGNDNVLIGYAGNDDMDAGAGDDDVHGGAGADTINGDDGMDYLHGGAGNDTVDGDAGDDILYGGDGLDTLWGDGGDDTFVFMDDSAFNDVDVIKDFDITTDEDVLDIADILSVNGYENGVDTLTDWVEITTNGSDSEVRIDTTGSASFGAGTQIATLEGITGLTDEAALVTSGNLVVV